jgi:hypothetical protein
MKYTVHLILQAILCMAFLQFSLASDDWELVEVRDGVEVFESAWAEYSEHQYRGVSVIEQPIEVIAAVLSDISTYPTWFHRCSQAKKLPDNHHPLLDFLLYIVIDVPWPFADRDAVFHAATTMDVEAGIVVIRSRARADSEVAIHKDLVRITNSEQQWILEKITPHKTRTTFINRTAVSGSMASFIADLGSRATVVESLINMRTVAADPRYAKLAKELKAAIR